jgi:hypothetical protein
MTQTTDARTPTLSSHSPEYLMATADRASAVKLVNARRQISKWMVGQNASHAEEVKEKSRSGLPMKTNSQVLAYGSGSGFEIIHRRCNCDRGTAVCEHDPRTSPFDAEALEKAHGQLLEAEEALVEADRVLDETNPTFDVFAAARAAGAKWVWWPEAQRRDPRLYRYRGKPVTDDEVATVGVLELQRQVRMGRVVEVPS